MLSGKPVGPFFAGFQPILTNPEGPVRPPFYISHKLGRATKLAALSGDANGIFGLFLIAFINAVVKLLNKLH